MYFVVELYGIWIIGTVEMDVDVADDIGSMSVDTRSSISEVGEEGRCHCTHTRKYILRACHSAVLRDLHWLRVPERIEFKFAVLVFRCLHGTAPAYMAYTSCD